MSWEYYPEDGFTFDFSASFDEQVKQIKSAKGGSLKIGSHSYLVLKALFEGHTIDDYENPPLDARGYPVRNVRSRIADLRTKWNVCIGSRVKEGTLFKEYQIYGRDM